MSSKREEMVKEYYEVVSIVNAFTNNFLTIKAWSVTTASFAVGVGILKSGSPYIFLIALALSSVFWTTEIRYKIIQLAHLRRANELEKALLQDKEIATPRINQTYSEAASELIEKQKWKNILFWPQIMLPHLFVVILSIILFLVYSLG